MASDPQSKRLRLMIDSELDQPTADNARDAAGPDLAPHLGWDDLIDDDFDDDFDEDDEFDDDLDADLDDEDDGDI